MSGEPLPAGAPCCVPRFDGNPERIRIDSDGQPGALALDVAAGSVVDEPGGSPGLRLSVVHDTARRDRRLPRYGPRPRVPPIRLADDDELSVASINLERLFDTTDDRDVADAVLTEAAFQRRLTKASMYIRQSLRLPDIIAVAEVENLADAADACVCREQRGATGLACQTRSTKRTWRKATIPAASTLARSSNARVWKYWSIGKKGRVTIFASPTRPAGVAQRSTAVAPWRAQRLVRTPSCR